MLQKILPSQCLSTPMHQTSILCHTQPINMSGHFIAMRRYAQSCEAPDERRDASSAGQQPGSQQPVQPASAAQPVLETAALMQRPSASSAAALRVPACEVPAARDQLPAGPNLLPCQKVNDDCLARSSMDQTLVVAGLQSEVCWTTDIPGFCASWCTDLTSSCPSRHLDVSSVHPCQHPKCAEVGACCLAG